MDIYTQNVRVDFRCLEFCKYGISDPRIFVYVIVCKAAEIFAC